MWGSLRLTPITHHIIILTHHISILTYHISILTHYINILTYHISILTHYINILTHHINILTHHTSILTHHISILTLHIIRHLYHKHCLLWDFIAVHSIIISGYTTTNKDIHMRHTLHTHTHTAHIHTHYTHVRMHARTHTHQSLQTKLDHTLSMDNECIRNKKNI